MNNTADLWQETGSDIVFSFRIDEGIYELIKKIASTEERSINSQLNIFVKKSLTEYLRKDA